MKHEAEDIKGKQALVSMSDLGSSAASGEASAWDSQKGTRSPKSLELDNAYQEYHDRLEKGEVIDPDEYCARHPHLQSSLARLLQLHSFLVENDSLVATWEYPEVGSAFLHFTLLHELGEGAFAKVFLADDTELGRRAVLKLSRRAKAEAKIMGPIEHKNVVLVHSIAQDLASGLTAICMPYRGSATLEAVLDEIRTPPEMPASARIILEAAQYLPMPLDAGTSADAPPALLQHGTYVEGVRWIGAQIADALGYLHAHGICHGDLKPSNILMTPNGTPLLLDFNLSTTFQAEAAPFGGTLPYMAPEALATVGAKEMAALTGVAGAKADIYSFGVILYQLVTGKHPLGSFLLKAKPLELRDHLLARQKEGVIPACEVNPQVDRPLSDLIQRCLVFAPQERPKDAAAIAAALRPTPPKTTSARRRMLATAGVLFCALVIGAVFLNLNRGPNPTDALQAAEENYRKGNYAETIRACQDLALADPASTQALFLSARAKAKFAPIGGVSFFQSALDDYRTLDSRSPHGRYKAGIGYCFNGRGDHISALAMYRKALQPPSSYENAELLNNIGFSLMKISNTPEMWQEAGQALDRAIQMKPNLAMPYYNRGLLALNIALRKQPATTQKTTTALGKNAKAPTFDQLNRTIVQGIRDFQSAIEKGEDSAGVYFDTALSCAVAAKTDRARAKDAVKYLRSSLERGQNRRSLSHVGFNAMREDMAGAKLDQIMVIADKSVPTVRFLDPVLD